MSEHTPSEITQMLLELTEGNQEVVNKILPHIYDELRRLAGGYLRRERSDHTLQPTALVHEAGLRLQNDPCRPQAGARPHRIRIFGRPGTGRRVFPCTGEQT